MIVKYYTYMTCEHSINIKVNVIMAVLQCIDFYIGPVPIPFGNYQVFCPYWGMMLVDNPLINNKAFLVLGWH